MERHWLSLAVSSLAPEEKPLQRVRLAQIDPAIQIEESNLHSGKAGAAERKRPKSQTTRMAILWEAEQLVQEAHSPSRPQRVQRTDAERTGECRRISGDCSERDPDSHLKFTGSEALPE
jgi:hypothetical protein